MRGSSLPSPLLATADSRLIHLRMCALLQHPPTIVLRAGLRCEVAKRLRRHLFALPLHECQLPLPPRRVPTQSNSARAR